MAINSANVLAKTAELRLARFAELGSEGRRTHAG